MSELVGGIHYEVDLDTGKMIQARRKVDRELDELGASGERLQARYTAIAAAISAALSSIAVGAIIGKVIQAQRQFDVMFASLKTMTGGIDQANDAWARLEKFAATTPYSLQQAVDGFVKLKALGLDPSERSMTSFGNTAAAMGKDLTQMIEAVADASTNEFERLKEFGIKAKQQGDNVSLTFRGVTTTIGNNSAEIVEYLTKIGETEFAGAMSERMKTLDGDISNLQDSLDALYRTIAQSGFGDAIAAGVRKATEAIQEASLSIRDGDLTEYFDRLRPLITATEVAVVSLAGALTGRLLVAMAANIAQAYAAATAIGAATVATRGFAAVIATLGGPIGIAVTGLALLALNWDKITGAAKTAAEVSENSAARIAAALAKRPSAATSDLKAQLDDAKKTLAELDKEIAAGSVRSIYGNRPTVMPADQLAKLKAQRDEVAAVVGDITRAMDSLHGGAGRGKVNPALVVPDEPGPPPPPKPTKPTKAGGQQFDGAAYLASLQRDTLDGIARIDAAEKEALRRNAQLLAEKKISAQEAAQAVTLIERNAAQDRLDIQLQRAEDMRAAIEQAGREELVLRQKMDADIAAGRDLATQTIVGGLDPVARIQYEAELKSQALLEAAMRDQANLQLYADARVSLEQQTADRIAQIQRQQQASQDAANSALFTSYSNLFGNVAEVTRQFAGEQSSAFKVLFAASKAFAIAESIIKIQQGIANAAALPFPANLAAMGSVIAATGSIVSTIQGVRYGGGRQYGGPVSANSLYRVNETGRPEMFTAANGAQYMMPTASGKVTAADKLGGPTVLQLQVINQHPTAQVTQRQGSDGNPQLVISEVASQIADHRGPIWSALQSTTNVRSAL